MNIERFNTCISCHKKTIESVLTSNQKHDFFIKRSIHNMNYDFIVNCEVPVTGSIKMAKFGANCSPPILLDQYGIDSLITKDYFELLKFYASLPHNPMFPSNIGMLDACRYGKKEIITWCATLEFHTEQYTMIENDMVKLCYRIVKGPLLPDSAGIRHLSNYEDHTV
ncbi:MAG: hypothetical protein JKX76_02450 [Colwellia sp.]|nr:hypothetical protein [Colwellia sp.]